MPLHSIISCSGWEATGGGWIASGPCIQARIFLVLLFFLIAIIRKWGGEEMGIDFNFIASLIGAIVPYLLIITLLGSVKIALLVGIVGGLVGGYGAGMFLGGGDGD